MSSAADKSLKLILDAEKQADAVRKGAVAAAIDMVAEASEKNDARAEAGIAAAEEEMKATLAEINAKADEIVKKERAEATVEAGRLEHRASKAMPAAVKLICWELNGGSD